jgi:hypothetical protein
MEERDITANVIEALRWRTPGLRARIERSVPRPLRRYAFEFEFAGVEGSAIYRAFAEGELTYRRLLLRHGSEPSPSARLSASPDAIGGRAGGSVPR